MWNIKGNEINKRLDEGGGGDDGWCYTGGETDLQDDTHPTIIQNAEKQLEVDKFCSNQRRDLENSLTFLKHHEELILDCIEHLKTTTEFEASDMYLDGFGSIADNQEKTAALELFTQQYHEAMRAFDETPANTYETLTYKLEKRKVLGWRADTIEIYNNMKTNTLYDRFTQKTPDQTFKEAIVWLTEKDRFTGKMRLFLTPGELNRSWVDRIYKA